MYFQLSRSKKESGDLLKVSSAADCFNIIAFIFEYLRWCSVLDITPKEERVTRPMVCQRHFSSKDVDLRTGFLTPRAVPKRTLVEKYHREKRRSKESSKESSLIESETESKKLNALDKELEKSKDAFNFIQLQPLDIKTEPWDETTEIEYQIVKEEPNEVQPIIEISESDFLDSLLPSMASMNCKQKTMFKREMMKFIVES